MSLAEARGLVARILATKKPPAHTNEHPTASASQSDQDEKPQAPVCHLEEHDPHADRSRLEMLAHACDRFSPIVGLEQREAPDGLVMDVTGLAGLFGGEQNLAEHVVESFRRWGYITRVAIADTLGAAWACAHFGSYIWQRIESDSDPEDSTAGEIDLSADTESEEECEDGGLRDERLPWEDALSERLMIGGSFCPHVIPVGDRQSLDAYPTDALRLQPATLETLHHLGISSIEQLQSLPREALATRLEKEVLQRLDQLHGRLPEPIVAWRDPVPFRAEYLCEYPIHARETIEELIRRKVIEVCQQMRVHRQGAVRLECRLLCEDRQRVALRVGLFEPTAGPNHLMDLMRMQLERLELRRAVQSIEMEVLLSAPQQVEQFELFQSGQQASRRELSALLNRLSSRLGRERVLQVELQPGAQPEHAFRYVPITGRRPAKRPATRRAARKRRKIDLRGEGIALPGGTRPDDPVEHGQQHWVGRTSSARPRDESAEAQLEVPGWESPLERPVEILPKPELLEMTALSGGGPPGLFVWRQRRYRISRHWGPERIETGWWRGPSVRRDYYRVETEAGQRFWIYHERHHKKWYLHGIYG